MLQIEKNSEEASKKDKTYAPGSEAPDRKGSRINSAFRASADSIPMQQLQPQVFNLPLPLPKQTSLYRPRSNHQSASSLNQKIPNASEHLQENCSTYQILLPGQAVGQSQEQVLVPINTAIKTVRTNDQRDAQAQGHAQSSATNSVTQEGLNSASNSNVHYQIYYCDPVFGFMAQQLDQGRQPGQNQQFSDLVPKRDGQEESEGGIHGLLSASASATGWTSQARLNDRMTQGKRPQTQEQRQRCQKERRKHVVLPKNLQPVYGKYALPVYCPHNHNRRHRSLLTGGRFGKGHAGFLSIDKQNRPLQADRLVQGHRPGSKAPKRVASGWDERPTMRSASNRDRDTAASRGVQVPQISGVATQYAATGSGTGWRINPKKVIVDLAQPDLDTMKHTQRASLHKLVSASKFSLNQSPKSHEARRRSGNAKSSRRSMPLSQNISIPTQVALCQQPGELHNAAARSPRHEAFIKEEQLLHVKPGEQPPGTNGHAVEQAALMLTPRSNDKMNFGPNLFTDQKATDAQDSPKRREAGGQQEIVVLQSTKKAQQFIGDSEKNRRMSKLLKGIPSNGGSFSNTSATKIHEELTLKPNMTNTMHELQQERKGHKNVVGPALPKGVNLLSNNLNNTQSSLKLAQQRVIYHDELEAGNQSPEAALRRPDDHSLIKFRALNQAVSQDGASMLIFQHNSDKNRPIVDPNLKKSTKMASKDSQKSRDQASANRAVEDLLLDKSPPFLQSLQNLPNMDIVVTKTVEDQNASAAVASGGKKEPQAVGKLFARTGLAFAQKSVNINNLSLDFGSENSGVTQKFQMPITPQKQIFNRQKGNKMPVADLPTQKQPQKESRSARSANSKRPPFLPTRQSSRAFAPYNPLSSKNAEQAQDDAQLRISTGQVPPGSNFREKEGMQKHEVQKLRRGYREQEYLEQELERGPKIYMRPLDAAQSYQSMKKFFIEGSNEAKSKCDQQNQINLSQEGEQEIHIEDEERRAATGTGGDEAQPVEVSSQILQRNNFAQFGVIASVADTAGVNESQSSNEPPVQMGDDTTEHHLDSRLDQGRYQQYGTTQKLGAGSAASIPLSPPRGPRSAVGAVNHNSARQATATREAAVADRRGARHSASSSNAQLSQNFTEARKKPKQVASPQSAQASPPRSTNEQGSALRPKARVKRVVHNVREFKDRDGISRQAVQQMKIDATNPLPTHEGLESYRLEQIEMAMGGQSSIKLTPKLQSQLDSQKLASAKESIQQGSSTQPEVQHHSIPSSFEQRDGRNRKMLSARNRGMLGQGLGGSSMRQGKAKERNNTTVMSSSFSAGNGAFGRRIQVNEMSQKGREAQAPIKLQEFEPPKAINQLLKNHKRSERKRAQISNRDLLQSLNRNPSKFLNGNEKMSQSQRINRLLRAMNFSKKQAMKIIDSEVSSINDLQPLEKDDTHPFTDRNSEVIITGRTVTVNDSNLRAPHQQTKPPVSQIGDTVLLPLQDETTDQMMKTPQSPVPHQEVASGRLTRQSASNQDQALTTNIQDSTIVSKQEHRVKDSLHVQVAINKQSMREGVISQRYKQRQALFMNRYDQKAYLKNIMQGQRSGKAPVSGKRANKLAHLKNAVAKNDNMHALRGFVPAQRSLKFFDQELNCQADIAQKQLAHQLSSNAFSASSKTLIGNPSRPTHLYAQGNLQKAESNRLDIHHQRHQSSGNSFQFAQAHKVPTPRHCPPSAAGKQAQDGTTSRADSNRYTAGGVVSGRSQHRIPISIKSQQSVQDRRPGGPGLVTSRPYRDDVQRARGHGFLREDKSGNTQRALGTQKPSQTEPETKLGSQRWSPAKRLPNQDLFLMPEHNITAKTGNFDLQRDFIELNSALEGTGADMNESARQQIMQKSKDALQPLLLYQEHLDQEMSRQHLQRVTFGSVSPGSADTGSGKLLKQGATTRGTDPSKVDAYGSGLNTQEPQALSPKLVSDQDGLAPNEDILRTREHGQQQESDAVRPASEDQQDLAALRQPTVE